MDEIKILEYSACGNRQSARKLKYRGDQDLRVVFAIKKMIEKTSWDLISIRDIPFHSLKHLEPALKVLGYGMYINPAWENVKEKWRYRCLSVLFVKGTVEFSQIVERTGFDTVLRYVCGVFEFDGHDILFRTSHIPCVDDTRSQLSKQIDRKKKMLEADIDFQHKHRNDCAICSGDYNGSANEEDCYCKEMFDDFIFCDLIKENTYEDQQLDHVYISEGFKSEGIAVDAHILDEYYMQLTDHRMISITLRSEAE